eukprot:SAG31_NODE_1738_length_7402_cov_14.270163_1_plen_93_part_00
MASPHSAGRLPADVAIAPRPSGVEAEVGLTVVCDGTALTGDRSTHRRPTSATSPGSCDHLLYTVPTAVARRYLGVDLPPPPATRARSGAVGC